MVLTTDRAERVAPGATLHTSDAPLRVETSRRHQNGWLVLFDGVLTRNQADELRGTVLFAEPLDDPDVDWVHELIGMPMVDTAGNALGTVASVEDNPASDLLVLDSGALVPMTFVVSTGDGTIVVDLPEGLLDL